MSAADLARRLVVLEAKNAPRGPLLLSWQLNSANRARADWAGNRYVQEIGETREAFLARVGAIASEAGAVAVWVSPLDGAL